MKKKLSLLLLPLLLALSACEFIILDESASSSNSTSDTTSETTSSTSDTETSTGSTESTTSDDTSSDDTSSDDTSSDDTSSDDTSSDDTSSDDTSSDDTSSSDDSSSDDEEFTGDVDYTVTPHEWTDERDYSYTYKLEKPSNIVSNIEEMEDIVDYYAFYKIEKFAIKLTDDYEYACGRKDISSELDYLYWHSELINGVMGFNAIDKGNNVWEFSYIIYKNAYKTFSPFFTQWNDVLYKTPTSDRPADYDNFATDDENKPVVDVATTQQLWFAAEHDYCINVIPNSPAANYYAQAKQLLRTIIPQNATYMQKLSTIYDYIHHTTTYDYNALDEQDGTNPRLYPDEFCSGDKCYFLEGFFDNHLVVCDGFSKIYTLLGKMEGLDIVRGSGTSDRKWTTREVAGHAYCFVKYENVWYLSDLTWGQYQDSYGDRRSCNYHHYFLAPHSAIQPYDSNEWPELGIVWEFPNSSYEKGIEDYFKTSTYTYDGETYSKYITDSSNSTFDRLNNLLKKSGTMNTGYKNNAYLNVYAADASVASAAYNYFHQKGLNVSYFRAYSTSAYEMLIMVD